MNQATATATATENEDTSEMSSAEATLKKYENTPAEAIIKELGGSERGCINRAIYKLTELGLTKGATAKLLNKRFQHVRNVLHNQALQKAKRAASPIAGPTSQAENLDPKNSGQASAQPRQVSAGTSSEKIETMTTKSGISLPRTGFKTK